MLCASVTISGWLTASSQLYIEKTFRIKAGLQLLLLLRRIVANCSPRSIGGWQFSALLVVVGECFVLAIVPYAPNSLVQIVGRFAICVRITTYRRIQFRGCQAHLLTRRLLLLLWVDGGSYSVYLWVANRVEQRRV